MHINAHITAELTLKTLWQFPNSAQKKKENEKLWETLRENVLQYFEILFCQVLAS